MGRAYLPTDSDSQSQARVTNTPMRGHSHVTNEHQPQSRTKINRLGACDAQLSLPPSESGATSGPCCSVLAGHAGNHQAYYRDRLYEWPGDQEAPA